MQLHVILQYEIFGTQVDCSFISLAIITNYNRLAHCGGHSEYIPWVHLHWIPVIIELNPFVVCINHGYGSEVTADTIFFFIIVTIVYS